MAPRRKGYAAQYDLKTREEIVLQRGVTTHALPSVSAMMDLPRRRPRDPRYTESDEDLDYQGYNPLNRSKEKGFMQDLQAASPTGYDPNNQTNAFFGSSEGSNSSVRSLGELSATPSERSSTAPNPRRHPRSVSSCSTLTNLSDLSADYHAPLASLPDAWVLDGDERPGAIDGGEGGTSPRPAKRRNLNQYDASNARIPAGARAANKGLRMASSVPNIRQAVPPSNNPLRNRRIPATAHTLAAANTERVTRAKTERERRAGLLQGLKKFGEKEGVVIEPRKEKFSTEPLVVRPSTPNSFTKALSLLSSNQQNIGSPNFPVRFEVPSSVVTSIDYDNGFTGPEGAASMYSRVTLASNAPSNTSLAGGQDGTDSQRSASGLSVVPETPPSSPPAQSLSLSDVRSYRARSNSPDERRGSVRRARRSVPRRSASPEPGTNQLDSARPRHKASASKNGPGGGNGQASRHGGRLAEIVYLRDSDEEDYVSPSSFKPFAEFLADEEEDSQAGSDDDDDFRIPSSHPQEDVWAQEKSRRKKQIDRYMKYLTDNGLLPSL